MKKLISILAVIALMAALLVPAVSAEEAKPTLTVSSATAAVGEEVTLEVTLSNNPGISNGKLTVTFDETALELVEIIFYEETEDDEVEYILGKLNGMNNEAVINFVGARDNKKDGIAFKVAFKVLEKAAGDVAVSLDVEYIDGDTQQNIAFDIVAGKVTVESNEPEHTCNPVDVAEVPATCTADGVKAHKKCECGKLYVDGVEVTAESLVIKSAGHTWGEWVVTKEPTTTEKGEETRTCSVCNATETRDVAVLVEEGCKHENLVHVEAVAPGCHFTGNIEHWYCNDCEMVWEDEALTLVTNHMSVILPATGGEIVHVEAVEPGCHFTGNIEHWYCTECDQVWEDEALIRLTTHLSVIRAELGGDVVHVEAVEPTCTENGNIEHWYCETCEQVWQDEARTRLTNHKNVILPAGHKLVHVEAVAPGCHFTGNVEHWYCTVCDSVWTDEALTQISNHMSVIVPELGGDVIHVEAKAPTCTENGNIEHWYCETCEQVWQDEARTQLTNHKNVVDPALGHDYVDGICTRCGEDDRDVPNTADMGAVFFALAAVTAGAVIVLKKKED